MARDSSTQILPEEILKAYTLGYFPMARAHDDDEIVWVLPEERGVLLLNQTKVPRKLRRLVARDEMKVTTNQCFSRVIQACAERDAGPSAAIRLERDETWINDDIAEVYCRLHGLGFAHSVECWYGEQLVGGLYGLSLGGVFFGESMFSRMTNASKIAFTHLIGRLKIVGYDMIDTQFYTDHLGQFGVMEMANDDYQEILETSLMKDVNFPVTDNYSSSFSTSLVLQSITQTS